MTVQLFIPCFADRLYPEVGFATIKLLEKFGCTVLYQPNIHCCGRPAYLSGYIKEAKAVSSVFLQDFAAPEMIVAPSGSCVSFVRRNLPEMYEPGRQQETAQKLAERTFELSVFLTEVLKINQVPASLKGNAVFLDSCGAAQDCTSQSGARKLLAGVHGLTLLASAQNASCCGFGGTFATTYQPIAEAMAHSRIQEAVQLGADYIISTDASCLLHLKTYINKLKSPVKVLHFAEVLSNF